MLLRTSPASYLLLTSLVSSLVAGCAGTVGSDTGNQGPGGKADDDSNGLEILATVTTLGPYNEIRWPFAEDSSSYVDNRINDALDFESITDENLDDIKRQWATGDDDTPRFGVNSADFTVTANLRNVLSLTISYETMGAYPDFQDVHRNFNNMTGEQVSIAEILDASKLPLLAARLDVRLQEEILMLKQLNRAAIESGEISATQWDGLHITANDLYSYSTNADPNGTPTEPATRGGIVFHWDAGFPHELASLTPPQDYGMSFDELEEYMSDDGLWAEYLDDNN